MCIACMHVYMYVYVYAHVCVCVYIRMYKCIYYVYIYVYIYIYISGHKWSTTHRVLKSHRNKVSNLMCNRTSCAQVHGLPQGHCGDSREGTLLSWLHIYIYIYIWCVCDTYVIFICYNNCAQVRYAFGLQKCFWSWSDKIEISVLSQELHIYSQQMIHQSYTLSFILKYIQVPSQNGGN